MLSDLTLSPVTSKMEWNVIEADKKRVRLAIPTPYVWFYTWHDGLNTKYKFRTIIYITFLN